MNDNQLRALLAVQLRIADNSKNTDDYYLGQAQTILESSYVNYKSPVNDTATIGKAIDLLVLNGYTVTPPGS